ncbi:energy transducer TonB [Croceibacterium mercuriale]|uniref:energy transducer TonB n=1 Tax=Croceibacterium mercuriale TaxID=1572751 RepID=UPI001F29DDA3|nr:energy transducer TonB [Croceibacterium mercuriale]
MFGLVQAFAPDLAGRAVEQAEKLVAVFEPVAPPPVPPPPPARPVPEPAVAPVSQPNAGASAPPAPRATPRPVMVPTPPVALSRLTLPDPPVSADGPETRSGAVATGDGTGAGGTGSGTGSGSAGQGQGGGGGAVTRPEKIAGNINDARDYPIPPGGREVRRGHYVVVHMIVGVDGRARQCRVVEASPDPAADRRTCQLAEDRFRFRPARNAAGEPVAAAFGWRQDWF